MRIALRVISALSLSIGACDARAPSPAGPQTPAGPPTPADTQAPETTVEPTTPSRTAEPTVTATPSPATTTPPRTPREARAQIAKLFDAAASNFNEDRTERGKAQHFCANDGRARGETGPTPPLSVKCSAAPGGLCNPSTSADTAPGSYDAKVWADNPVWRELGVAITQPHTFHYNFIWENTGTDFGECLFTVQAVADLDGDNVWSTFERTGVGNVDGITASAGIYIDQARVTTAIAQRISRRGSGRASVAARRPPWTHRARSCER